MQHRREVHLVLLHLGVELFVHDLSIAVQHWQRCLVDYIEVRLVSVVELAAEGVGDVMMNCFWPRLLVDHILKADDRVLGLR